MVQFWWQTISVMLQTNLDTLFFCSNLLCRKLQQVSEYTHQEIEWLDNVTLIWNKMSQFERPIGMVSGQGLYWGMQKSRLSICHHFTKDESQVIQFTKLFTFFIQNEALQVLFHITSSVLVKISVCDVCRLS
jgi:hypothetical protein